jgi:S1-C subfamily serine protease
MQMHEDQGSGEGIAPEGQSPPDGQGGRDDWQPGWSDAAAPGGPGVSPSGQDQPGDDVPGQGQPGPGPGLPGPGYSQPGFDQPGSHDQPGFAPPTPGYGHPGYDPPGPGYGQPGASQPGSGQPSSSQPGASQPGQPGASQPSYSQPGYSQPGYGPPGSSQPSYGPPGSSQPSYGLPNPSQPSYGQPGSSQPSYGPPGHPGYSQPGYPGGYGPAYGTVPYGQPGYGQPGYGGYLPPADARRRRRRGIIAYVVVAAVAAATGAGAVLTLHHNPSASSPAGGTGRASGNSNRSVSSGTEHAVVSAVQPGLVDISSSLGYQGGAAAATGMVISSNGLVLTNNHVITDTTGLVATVVTSGRRFAAKWLGYDSAADVAVIQLVGAHGLRTIPIGNSSGVKLGDNVVALGNAEGAGGAPAVVGSITGLNRTITASDSGAGTSETLHGMLQTNAGIVQGDSGGALASTAGKVIGMNTAAASGSFGDGTQNVGFAIPINTALAIANKIIHGQSGPTIQIGSTGFMGVLVPAGKASQSTKPREQRLLQAQQDGTAFAGGTACLRNDLGAGVPAKVAPASTGALIIGEICGTPAAKAGIVAGDVITAVGGHPVSSPKQLTGIMLGFKPGVGVVVAWVDVTGRRHSGKLLLVQAPPR